MNGMQIFMSCWALAAVLAYAYIRGATRPSTREERRHDYLEVPRT